MSGPPNFKKSQTEALAIMEHPAKGRLRIQVPKPSLQVQVARPQVPRVPPPPRPPVAAAAPDERGYERLIFPAPLWMVARLEEERKRLGFRSRSETIRHFLDEAFREVGR